MSFLSCGSGGGVSSDKLMPSIVIKSSGVEKVNAEVRDSKSISSGGGGIVTTPVLTVNNNLSCHLKLTPQNLAGSQAVFYKNGSNFKSVSSTGSGNVGEWDITLNKGDEIYAWGKYGSGSSSSSVAYILSNIKCI